MMFKACFFIISEILLGNKFHFLTDFNFLNSESAGEAIKLIHSTSGVGMFTNLVWAVAWAIYAALAFSQIVKVIMNTKRGSGDFIKLGVRLAVSGVLLANWYKILNKFLSSLSLVLARYFNPISAALKNFNLVGDGHIIKIGDSIAAFGGGYVMECILVFSLATSVITAGITYLERYLALGFYCLISPISAAMAASEETQSNLKDWVMGLVPQFLGMGATLILMGFGLNAIKQTSGFLDGWDGEILDNLIYIALGVVYFSLAKNTEKFFNSMGFRTMSMGDAARSAMAGTATAFGVAMAGTNMVAGSKIAQEGAKAFSNSRLGQLAGKVSNATGKAGAVVGSVAGGGGGIEKSPKQIASDSRKQASSQPNYNDVRGGVTKSAAESVAKASQAQQAINQLPPDQKNAPGVTAAAENAAATAQAAGLSYTSYAPTANELRNSGDTSQSMKDSINYAVSDRNSSPAGPGKPAPIDSDSIGGTVIDSSGNAVSGLSALQSMGDPSSAVLVGDSAAMSQYESGASISFVNGQGQYVTGTVQGIHKNESNGATYADIKCNSGGNVYNDISGSDIAGSGQKFTSMADVKDAVQKSDTAMSELSSKDSHVYNTMADKYQQKGRIYKDDIAPSPQSTNPSDKAGPSRLGGKGGKKTKKR